MSRGRTNGAPRGSLLIFSGREGSGADSTSPKTLARQEHWESVASLGPWVSADGFCEQAPGRWWRSVAANPAATVVFCGECSSSLDVAWALIGSRCLLPFDSVLASSQRAGRGQLRRPWVSPAGNVHAAWLWPRLERPLDSLASLLAGLVLVKTFQAVGLRLRLKWPNDLLLNDRKVGGILVEERRGRLLLGVGLNLHHAPPGELLRRGHAHPAGLLQGPGIPSTPPELWLKLVEEGLPWYEICSTFRDPGLLIREIERNMAFIGQQVRVTGQQTPDCTATVLGLSREGWLRCDSGGKERLVRTGSIAPT